MYEYVYMFINPCMPDWIKVGKTKNIKNRLASLNHKTAVPIAFECYAALKVPESLVSNVEAHLHKILERFLDKEKEFFKTNTQTVYECFQSVQTLNPDFILETYAGGFCEPAVKQKNANTTFKMLNIPIGATLTFVKDPTVICTVNNEINQVIYNGQTYSISALAIKLLNYKVNGFQVFSYENKTLWQRRCELEPSI